MLKRELGSTGPKPPVGAHGGGEWAASTMLAYIHQKYPYHRHSRDPHILV
jgi:hypothetical protein